MSGYINYLKNNNFSNATIKTYESILKVYIKYINKYNDVISTLITYENSNTFRTHYGVLMSYYKYANIKMANKLSKIRLPEIINEYKLICSKEYIYLKTQNLEDYRNVIIRFLFETGIRGFEIKNIISINKNTLTVKGKGNKIREIWHNSQTTKLFEGFEYSLKTLRKWVKQILGEQYSTHSIRRSHATHFLTSGVPLKIVMLQLGHKNINTTMKYINLNKAIHIRAYEMNL